MASGRFVDPMTLLRVTPLVTSTAAVMFSVDQYLFLDNLLAPPHREQMNELVPSYYKTFFRKGIWIIMTAYPVSIATGVANVYRSSGERPPPNSAAGTTARGAGAVRGRGQGEGNRNLRRWLDVHLVRSVLVDVPSWLCFATACLKSLGPQPQ
ncbi:uncharacterized protein PG986_012243 [Apiospora aurea]|uniref:Uncharacterized protein n=1 Tax=Apiospora aurea TaxID=335848 RepID=A0ABR1PZP4_9PEZI